MIVAYKFKNRENDFWVKSGYEYFEAPPNVSIMDAIGLIQAAYGYRYIEIIEFYPSATREDFRQLRKQQSKQQSKSCLKRIIWYILIAIGIVIYVALKK